MATVPSGTKFLGVDSSLVDLTERKGNQLDSKTEYFSTDEIRGYKVYTALLTQSGGDDEQSIYDVPLVIGVTYFINNNNGSIADFTNVGATTNEQGTYFVATGTTPNNWGTVGNVDLTYNAGAPVATVLENTIGNIWFQRQSEGSYDCLSSGLFKEGKTFITISALGRPLIFASRYFNDNQIQIQTTTTSYDNQEWNNEFPGNFEIRVYN